MAAAASLPELSIVVPVYNERQGLQIFHTFLVAAAEKLDITGFEIIYCDDGSSDGTTALLAKLCDGDRVKLIRLSRNFGKELATTAGIYEARGSAIITLDADGQHPVTLLPYFISTWRSGNRIVIGRRIANQKEGFVKRLGSTLFYKLFNQFTGMKLIPGASDYRLIDRSVQTEFNRMTERNRITRGLIDWLGYKRAYIDFTANARETDISGYSFKKLLKLAVDSVVSLSISPLYVAAYVGAIVLPGSVLLGLGMFVNWLLGDPLGLHATGGAYAMVFALFLIGILLVSQGIIGLYLSHIHAETQNRPLYIIDKQTSKGLS